MNNHIKLSFKMDSLIFLNTLEFFQNFLTFLTISFSKKIQGYNRGAIEFNHSDDF